VDAASGDTFWTQSTPAPNPALGLVTIHDNAPTNDQWNYAAVEVVAAPVSGGAFAATASAGFKAARAGHVALLGLCAGSARSCSRACGGERPAAGAASAPAARTYIVRACQQPAESAWRADRGNRGRGASPGCCPVAQGQARARQLTP